MSSKISLLNVSLAIYIGFVLSPKKHKYLPESNKIPVKC